MKKLEVNKVKILLGIPLALISLRIYLGAVFGYFFAKFLSSKLSSIIFNVGSYQFHFHHWIMGLIGLVFLLILNNSLWIDKMIIGFLSGLVFEGITSYPDWYKVITKKSS